MISLHPASSPRWWCRYKSSSNSICFSILLCIIGYQTGLFCDSRHVTGNTGSTLWVQSFTPATSPNNQQCVHQRQRHFRFHQTERQTASKPLAQPSLLCASGENGDDTGSATTTKVVYSVFSKPPNKVFNELLAASATTTTTTSSDGDAGLLGLNDICGSISENDEGGWSELNEMVDDGDLTVEELRALFNSAVVDQGEALDLEGFKRFYQSIDNLFDDDDNDDDEDDEENSDAGEPKEEAKTEIESSSSSNDNNYPKEDLVSYVEEVQKRQLDSDDGTVNVGERRPWGLDCTDRERKEISVLIERLLAENDSSNILGTRNNNKGLPMTAKDLTKYILGTWDLKYTSSRTMIINKSLSGLGRSTSDMARNLGLQMTLSGNYYFGKAEFVEKFGSGGDDSNEDEESDSSPVLLEAVVTGEWILETGTRMDYKTGLPSVSLRVEVETIAYGPNTSNAEQWDSLSPIKLVDVLYLDDNLIVLRGNANVDAIFVYTRR